MAYVGFDKLKSKIEGEGKSASSAGAIAASIGRKKYGASAFNKAAANGQSLKKSAISNALTKSKPKGYPIGKSDYDADDK